MTAPLAHALPRSGPGDGTAATPGHFQGLDFLRGVAAIAVVGFHLSSRLDLPALFAHGYLAVDFFFVLSGFVLAHAYGARLSADALGVRGFVRLRLLRLLPLVVFGTVLAAVIDLMRPGEFSVGRHLADIAAALVMGCLCLPTLWPTTLEATVFPLNSPVWSLCFELVANVAALPLAHLRRPGPVLGVAAAASLAALAWPALRQGSVNFGSVPADFWLGVPRVGWSFLLGVALTRVTLRLPALSKWAYAALLSLVLACPALPHALGGAYDLAAICLAFPVLVLGAAQCRGAHGRSRLSAWSGNLSYPLYATHYPLARAVGVVGRGLTQSAAAHLLIAGLSAACMVAFSAAVYVLYDVRLRRWLARRTGQGRRLSP